MNKHAAAVEVSKLEFRIKAKRLLQDVGFRVDRGESFAVVGHNGAGKTTLFQLILGIKFPNQGEIKIHGINNLDSSARGALGYLPERPYLDPEVRFKSHLRLHLDLIGYPRDGFAEEVDRVSKEVGLSENLSQRFKTFSKGMLQKAMLATALLGDPALLILDEPMSGLDPESRERMKERFANWKKLGKTLIFSSHAFEDVHEFADRVLELKSGRILFLGEPSSWRPEA